MNINLLEDFCLTGTTWIKSNARNAYLGIKERTHTLCNAFDMHNRRFGEKVEVGKKINLTLRRFEITQQKVIDFF